MAPSRPLGRRPPLRPPPGASCHRPTAARTRAPAPVQHLFIGVPDPGLCCFRRQGGDGGTRTKAELAVSTPMRDPDSRAASRRAPRRTRSAGPSTSLRGCPTMPPTSVSMPSPARRANRRRRTDRLGPRMPQTVGRRHQQVAGAEVRPPVPAPSRSGAGPRGPQDRRAPVRRALPVPGTGRPTGTRRHHGRDGRTVATATSHLRPTSRPPLPGERPWHHA